jgi:hypothetical protein
MTVVGVSASGALTGGRALGGGGAAVIALASARGR